MAVKSARLAALGCGDECGSAGIDGRIITVPISFKGEKYLASGVDGQSSVVHYSPISDRVEAVARLSMRLAALRRKANSEKRIAFMLTNSPGKADRIGNAVGLDTPASLMRLFAQMQEQNYQLENVPSDGDTLLHTLIDRCSYDVEHLTESQLAEAAGRVEVAHYDGC